MREVKLSTLAISDHMSRLYDEHNANGNTVYHIDGSESGVITIINEGKKISTVLMDDNAVREFISDMDYQVEVSEDSWERAYGQQCARALKSIKSQVIKTVTTEGKPK